MCNNFFIVNHYKVYGAGEAFKDYLFKSKINYIYIACPYDASGNQYILEFYYNEEKKKKIFNNLFFVKFKFFFDIIFIIFYSIKYSNKSFTLIAINPLNFFLSSVFGTFKKKIFFAIDFTNQRFDNMFLNWIYHKIEFYSFTNSEINWCVSKKIIKARNKYHSNSYFQFKSIKNIVVPIGFWRVKNQNKISRKNNQLVFVGHLLKKQGVDLVIRSLFFVKKVIKNIKFVIIGGGPELDNLKTLSYNLDLKKNIIFKGWIYDFTIINKILKKSYIGLATYLKEIISFTEFADPTKIKDYLSCGLPVIATNTFHNCSLLVKKNCVILLKKEDPVILSKIIIRSILKKNQVNLMRKNCYEYVQQFEWSKIFNKAIKQSIL